MGYLKYELLMVTAMGPITQFHFFLRYCAEEQHCFFGAM